MIAVWLCSMASGELAQSKDVAYYCVAAVAGDLWYNEKTKKWEGHSFRAEQKFVLKMGLVRSRVRGEEQVNDYKVTITESGQNTDLTCYALSDEETITIKDKDRILCTTYTHDYRFDLQRNRFLAIYPHGYLDGDNNNSTPAIEAGMPRVNEK
jgi:hypothetical protein